MRSTFCDNMIAGEGAWDWAEIGRGGSVCVKGIDTEEGWEGRGGGGGGGWKVEVEIGTIFSITVLSTPVDIEAPRFRDDVDQVS